MKVTLPAEVVSAAAKKAFKAQDLKVTKLEEYNAKRKEEDRKLIERCGADRKLLFEVAGFKEYITEKAKVDTWYKLKTKEVTRTVKCTDIPVGVLLHGLRCYQHEWFSIKDAGIEFVGLLEEEGIEVKHSCDLCLCDYYTEPKYLIGMEISNSLSIRSTLQSLSTVHSGDIQLTSVEWNLIKDYIQTN